MNFDRIRGIVSCGGFTFRLDELLTATVYNRPERRLQKIRGFVAGQAFEQAGRLRIMLRNESCGLLIPVEIAEDGPYLAVTVNAGEIVETYGTGYRLMELSVLPELLCTPAAEAGYYILPSYTGAQVRLGTGKTRRLRDRVYMAQEEWEKFTLLNCFCARLDSGATLAIVDDGDFFAWVDAELNAEGANRIYASFGIRHEFGEVLPQEKKRLLLRACGKVEYPALALAFREYLMDRRGVYPLRDRCRNNPVLQYSAEALRIKFFLGGKIPFVPDGSSPLVNCATFAEAEAIIDHMLGLGITKAVITLVGWNTGGHDGAYPQRFPIEETFGGEAGLRKLIAKATAVGYQIVPHDNHTDVYLNSPAFDYEYVARDESGQALASGLWSGGQAFKVCPAVCLERYAGDFKRVHALGFHGSYYLDAQGTGLWRCHDPHHPADEKQFALSLARILEYPRALFGAVSCEVGQVYTIPFTDEVAHLQGQDAFNNFRSRLNPEYADAIERILPFYHIALHGLVLYQGSWQGAFKNDPRRTQKALLMLLAHGSRPGIEVSVRALANGGEYRECLGAVRESYDVCYNLLAGHSCEMIAEYEDHNALGFRLVYQDGTEIAGDLAAGTGTIRRDGKVIREI